MRAVRIRIVLGADVAASTRCRRLVATRIFRMHSALRRLVVVEESAFSSTNALVGDRKRIVTLLELLLKRAEPCEDHRKPGLVRIGKIVTGRIGYRKAPCPGVPSATTAFAGSARLLWTLRIPSISTCRTGCASIALVAFISLISLISLIAFVAFVALTVMTTTAMTVTGCQGGLH